MSLAKICMKFSSVNANSRMAGTQEKGVGEMGHRKREMKSFRRTHLMCSGTHGTLGMPGSSSAL